MPMLKNEMIIPFLKWAGGKRWLVESAPDLFSLKYRNYIEPFLGAGSVFFHVKPERAILSDSNKELIACYDAIRNDWKLVLKHLKRHRKDHSKDYYYELRSFKPRSPATQAARFIYLNRTCFNGLYRVNRNGEFNVPKGTRDSVILDTDDFKTISLALQNVSLVACDFEKSIKQARCGDLVFADPPYTVRHNNNAFIKYNENLFSWDDQVRLAECLKDAASRGVKIIATNANHASIVELYKNIFTLSPVSRKSNISANRTFRGNYEELLIQANN
jgi:DNA adenine methylase